MFTYVIILTAVLVISPFVLRLAASQRKETKQQFKFVLLILLSAQFLLGFLNWENLTSGRSGFELSSTYLNSYLILFFIVSLLQIFLLIISQSFDTLVVVLNFINTIIIFLGMIRLSNMLGFQIMSFPSILAIFLVLIGNVLFLAYVNKDKNILKKYPF